jgi:hypothetical protein
LPLQQQQRCLHIAAANVSLTTSDKGSDIDDDNNAILTRATTSSGGWQQCKRRLHIDSNNTITTKATTPAQ